MTDPEPLWIAAARGGDHQAFRHLVDAHARALFPVCRRLLGDAASAEDAVQEALLNAFRALDQYDGRASFRSWLHRIAVNAALAMVRTRAHAARQQQQPLEDCAATLECPALAPAEWLDAGQNRERLQRALADLSALERSAFVLRHVEQYALTEIAARLESNVNAIKQAVFRAVRKLRSTLGAAEESTA